MSREPATPPPSRARSVLYLHGFASSPSSMKATFFAERLRRHDVSMRCPDLNAPEFRSLTMTRMLGVVDRELASMDTPAALIGSSLGGALAILAAARFGAAIDRLVLLAPAVMFAKPGHHLLTPERVDEWRRDGSLPFFHYGFKEERRLDVAFYEDAAHYEPFDTRFPQPALVFQGLHDTSVDCRTVERFCAARPHVTLALVDDDHQLVASMPRIWNDAVAFLGLV